MGERWCPKTERECFLRPIIYGPRRWEFLEDKTCWHCQNLYKNDQALFKAKKKMLEKEDSISIYFRPEPKGNLGFKNNEGNKTK